MCFIISCYLCSSFFALVLLFITTNFTSNVYQLNYIIHIVGFLNNTSANSHDCICMVDNLLTSVDTYVNLLQKDKLVLIYVCV